MIAYMKSELSWGYPNKELSQGEMVGQNENLKAIFKRQMHYPQKNERWYCNKPKKYKDEFDVIQYTNEVVNLKCQQIKRKFMKKN